jgi:hypothetical protein
MMVISYLDFMKIWKGIFKKRFLKRRRRRIAENIPEGGILGGEMDPARINCKAEKVVNQEMDDVYSRCGEVFNAS